MKKSILTLTFIVFNFFGFTQETDKNIRQGKHYASIKSYKELYGDNFTKNDSLKFIIRENDTLVPLPNGYKRPNGVSVPYEAIDSTILEIYKDVVYQKYQPDSVMKKRKNFMRLWNKPIKIFFSESLDQEYQDVIIKLTNEITNRIDSLNISFVSNLEESNYVIYQIDEKNTYKYSKNIGKNKYIDFYNYWNKNRIYDTKLEINTTKHKNKKVNSNYLIQYFIRSLGHFFSTPKVPCKNILSSCNSSRKKFTELDFKILEYHYSYGICKGTDLMTFEEQHKRAKEILKKTNSKMSFLHLY